MRKTVVLLVLVFFGPLLAAVIAFYGPWAFAPSAAHGQIIEPPLPLPAEALPVRMRTAPAGQPRKWSVIYARTSACGEDCLEDLLRLHQVRLALGEDRGRVQTVLLWAGPDLPIPPEAEWITARLDDAAGKTIIQLLGEDAVRNGRIYIADPADRLMMTYPPDVEQSGLLEDLERLLDLSGTG